MKGQSIKRKFMTMFVMWAVFGSFIAAAGVYGTVKGKNSLEKLFREREDVDHAIGHLKEDIRDARIELLNMMTQTDMAAKLESRDKVLVLGADTESDFNAMLFLGFIADNDLARRGVIEAKSKWEEFRNTRDNELIPLILAGKDAESKRLVSSVQKKRYENVIKLLNDINEAVDISIEQRHKAVKTSGRRMILAIVFLTAGGFVLGISLFYRYSHYIISRIALLEDGAKRLSQGDLSSRVEVTGEDEIASLGAAFNHMADWIQEDMDTMLRSERELQERNDRLNEAMVEAQQHAKVIEFAAKEREKQNKQLVEMQSQLLQSEKMASVGQLAAGVAHEINNPVGYVNGNMSTLSAYIDDVKALDRTFMKFRAAVLDGNMVRGRELAAEIGRFREDKDVEFVFEDITKLLAESREGLERVTSIVRDLKHFSHVDEAERREFDINKGIESTINVAWNEIKYKAEVRRNYSELPPVFCYPQQLNQVFMNILVNAAHAISGDNGKGVIGIRTYQREDSVFIEISDNGSGIPEDKIDKIFEPFYTTKPVGKGTGLGLSMAYSIINKHKGDINVRSSVGEGTTFTIRLPLDPRDERSENDAESFVSDGI